MWKFVGNPIPSLLLSFVFCLIRRKIGDLSANKQIRQNLRRHRGICVMEASREYVLAWLAGLPEGPWLELMVAACAQRQPHPQDGCKYAVAYVWRFDEQEPWVVELVAAEDRSHYQGEFAPEDCTVIRAATCRGCGSRIGSWARVVRCLVCGEELSCH
ncbi:MAG: hypothetical protein ACRC8S_04450 [Fimbriiglobus sp.]